jgi:two-component system, OmpR family, alkaline phosphatase synthesis response regulator PhoP
MTRVLVVEDSPDLAFGLQTNLEIEGYEPALATDGEAALRLYDEFRPHIVILDLNIPKLNGYGVLQSLRDQGSTVPVLILSAQKEETAKIRGFRLGADDFVTKPFSVLELMARVEALLRRSTAQSSEAVRAEAEEKRVRFGDIDIDLTAQIVYRAGERVDLSPKAFELMVALFNRRGAVARREDLLRDVWGHRRMISTRTVDAHMLELRRKLEDDPANPRHFVTVRKAGYRFQR